MTEAIRTAMEHAGAPQSWWTHAARYVSVVRNVEKVNGVSSHFCRFERHFPGELLLFGCLVDFLPSPKV